MRLTPRTSSIALVDAFLLAIAASAPGQQAGARRPAEVIVQEFHAIEFPGMSDGSDPESLARFKRTIDEACCKQGQLALELWHGWPDHSQVPELMQSRWAGMNNALDEAPQVVAEVEALLKQEKLREDLKVEALLARGRAGVVDAQVPAATRNRWIETAIAAAPARGECGLLLTEAALQCESDPALLRAICDRVEKQWPGNEWTVLDVKAIRHDLALAGKLATLDFDDLLGSGHVRFADLRGKVVVVQTELGGASTVADDDAALKSVRTKLGKDKVALISVHAFAPQEGGVEALKKELAQRGVDWPQFAGWEGGSTPWESPWSSSRTPAFFVFGVDEHLAALTWRSNRLGELVAAAADSKPRRRAL